MRMKCEIAMLTNDVCFAVNHLSGQARLQFTRHPYTHWSFSFYDDPVLELQVESQFQGRPLPQITSIIVSQVKLLNFVKFLVTVY